jgi:hypothetical protein
MPVPVGISQKPLAMSASEEISPSVAKVPLLAKSDHSISSNALRR